MPKITINGRVCEFKPGQLILQVANEATIDVPQYCYHDGLSVVASCRICLAEVWMPDPKSGKLAPYMGGKLMPTCQTACMDGMVVYTDSPKAVANQKAVMEYLLINHPLDCPVCDQAGECYLQDYSYEYGRGQSRFEETKVKNPKKDVGPNIYLYSDRCIMCTRCVRFTREVSGSGELCVSGRGNREEIDVFPGLALDNELAGNVVDLCPVGALLDKDFLFAQRVWFLKETPSIDGLTASGDNISIHHNDGKIYRFKPRTNMSVNKWWITDEVRFGWRFVHSDQRLSGPTRTQFGTAVLAEWPRAISEAHSGLRHVVAAGKRIAVMVSPMLSCEDAYWLGRAAQAIDPKAFLAVGPVPTQGTDKVFPPGAKADDAKAFVVSAEKAPNARGVRRVLGALSKASAHNGYVASFEQLIAQLRSGEIGGVIITGNYPTAWATRELMDALSGKFVVVLDTLTSELATRADVLLPSATWCEKAGTFENWRGMLQAFEAATPVHEGARPEAQIALDLLRADGRADVPALFNAADTRRHAAGSLPELSPLVSDVRTPSVSVEQNADMEVVEL
ncbi:MAG: molybdopterin-dependent oxidoreductase [Planctomyces sp.]